jgi:uncharacterized protein (DUF2235 family)
MGKNIVLCLDGTWNSPQVKDAKGELTPTNVQRLFECLEGSGPLGPTDLEKEFQAPAQGAAVQVGKYIYGVGNSSNVLARDFEGAVGAGLIARVVRGYTFLSRNYQRGDRIYINGFSRGSYAARALAGFVAKQGLLDWNGMKLVADSKESYRAGFAAWHQYREALPTKDHRVMHFLADWVTDLYARFEIGLGPAPALQFVPDVPIQAVGVWDTVGAMGVPDINETKGIRLDVFEFADNKLNPAVLHGIQAIAIDEKRIDFTPSIWEERDGVVQVLFPGAHSDVGGGYAPEETGLSDIALLWMIDQVKGQGLRFDREPALDPKAAIIVHRPWIGSAFQTADRRLPANLRISSSALELMRQAAVAVQGSAPAPYRPDALADGYFLADWVLRDGTITEPCRGLQCSPLKAA